MKGRGRSDGVANIVRFNWPYYAVSSAVLVASSVLWFVVEGTTPRLALGLAALVSAHFVVVSLVVSHFVYDRSDLYRWQWLARATQGTRPRRVIYCHTGFDEASLEIRERLGPTAWQVLDHFDPEVIREASVRRARSLFPPTPGTATAPFDRWLVSTGSTDLIIALLAIHELRSESERSAWFKESRRCLSPDGRLILVEHVRDLANGLAFGPECLHFHTRMSWRRCWEFAGFQSKDEFRVTPFVRVFVLSPS